MKNTHKVLEIKDGYLIEKEAFDILYRGILDAISKLRFLEESFIALEDRNSTMKDNPFYGMDAIIRDIASGCDTLYESLDYTPA